MNKICILYLTITLFFAACSEKNDVFLRLAEADTLLYHGLVDSADALLMEINPQSSVFPVVFLQPKLELLLKKNRRRTVQDFWSIAVHRPFA